MNGVEIPALDPNQNMPALNAFQTAMVSNMQVSKTFAPYMPASFTGGLINIVTKEAPDGFQLSLSTKIGVNTRSSFRSDFLGFETQDMHIPAVASGTLPVLFEDNLRLEQISQSFSKQMHPQQANSLLNHSHSFSIGNQVLLGNKSLRFTVQGGYNQNFRHIENGTTGRYNLTGSTDEVNSLIVNRLLKDQSSTASRQYYGYANIEFDLNDRHTLFFNALSNHQATQNARIAQGAIPSDAPDIIYQARSLEYAKKNMQMAQLGSGYTSKNERFQLDWFTALISSLLDEPDGRYFNSDYTLNGGDTLYNLQGALYTLPTRFYRTLNQTTTDHKINMQYSLFNRDSSFAKLLGGAALLTKRRTLYQKRFNYQIQGVQYQGDVQAFLSDENMQLPSFTNPSQSYIYLSDASELRDNYKAHSNIASVYGALDYKPMPQVRFLLGLRAEKTLMSLITRDAQLPEGKLDNLDLLPSVNTTIYLKNDQNLRVGYTKTLARPNFREIAPFASFDFATSWVQIGNPNLQRTLIQNLDLRYENYQFNNLFFSVAAFYKQFKHSIELVFNPLSSSDEITWINTGMIDQQQSPYGRLYGLELECNTRFKMAGKDLQVGANFAYMRSSTQIDSLSLVVLRAQDAFAPNSRPMFGQSPYVLNTYASLELPKQNMKATLSYNVAGEKLAVVMVGALPDVYAQPIHRLDLKLSKQLSKYLQASFAVQNILDPEILLTHQFKGQSYVFNAYKIGRVFSLGLSYTLK